VYFLNLRRIANAFHQEHAHTQKLIFRTWLIVVGVAMNHDLLDIPYEVEIEVQENLSAPCGSTIEIPVELRVLTLLKSYGLECSSSLLEYLMMRKKVEVELEVSSDVPLFLGSKKVDGKIKMALIGRTEETLPVCRLVYEGSIMLTTKVPDTPGVYNVTFIMRAGESILTAKTCRIKVYDIVNLLIKLTDENGAPLDLPIMWTTVEGIGSNEAPKKVSHGTYLFRVARGSIGRISVKDSEVSIKARGGEVEIVADRDKLISIRVIERERKALEELKGWLRKKRVVRKYEVLHVNVAEEEYAGLDIGKAADIVEGKKVVQEFFENQELVIRAKKERIIKELDELLRR